MKKQKSKALMAIFTVVLSLLLSANIFLSNQENFCHSKIDKLIDEREMWIYSNTLQFTMLTTLLKDVNLTEGQSNKASGRLDDNMRNFTLSWMNTSANTQAEIFIVNNKIDEQRKECNNYSTLSDIFLYTALIVNIILLFCSLLIYQLYKK